MCVCVCVWFWVYYHAVLWLRIANFGKFFPGVIFSLFAVHLLSSYIYPNNISSDFSFPICPGEREGDPPVSEFRVLNYFPTTNNKDLVDISLENLRILEFAAH